MFTAAYYGLLCIGEIAVGSHPVLAPDVHIATNKRKILFILRTSKTHWKNNKPQMVKIISSTRNLSDDLCPLNILKQFMRSRPSCCKLTEPLFVFTDRSHVKPEHLRSTLKLLLLRARVDPEIYSMHSFHAGRSCDLLAMGLSVETIKKLEKLGRWRSNAVFTYLR